MAEIHAKTLWDQAYNRSGMLPKHRTVLNALRTWANPHTLECFATLEDISGWTGLSTSACWRQIKVNESAGWIEIVHTGHSGGKANEYRLLNPGVHAKVPNHQEEPNPSVHAMNPGVHAKETLASTHNHNGIKGISKEIPKGEGNPSADARDHSPHSAARVPASRSFDLSANPPEPLKGVKVQGDYNPSVDAKVSTAPTQRPPVAVHFEPSGEEIEEILAEHYATDTPQQRLLDAIRREGGSVPARSIAVADAVGQEASVIIPQMIAAGLIVHDVSTEPATLTLA